MKPGLDHAHRARRASRKANTVSPRSLPRRGWQADTVKSGDALTLHGNLGRDGAKRLWIQTLSLEGREPIYPVGRAP